MKLLTDPDWFVIAQKLTVEERSEILLAILGYPNYECNVPIWDYFKLQINKDQAKYRAKCERLAANRQNFMESALKNEISESIIEKSEPTFPISSPNSPRSRATTIEQSNADYQNNKTKHSNARAVDALIGKVAWNLNADAPKRYEINDDFKFERLAKDDPAIENLCNRVDETKLKKAERSLWSKRYGQKLTLQQLTAWIENEGEFKNNNTS